MKYRSLSFILGTSFFVGSGVIAYYSVTIPLPQSPPGNNQVLPLPFMLAFISLGLLLIGTLVFFITPENLLTSAVINSGLSPLSVDLALIIRNLDSKVVILHRPITALGPENEVFLVLKPQVKVASIRSSPKRIERVAWDTSSKALVPPGLELMRLYEKVLGRDFRGDDIDHLSRLLGKALVTELQLVSSFSLVSGPNGHFDVTWRDSIIRHTCLTEEGEGLAGLCCLCSSVACALARATGESILIDHSKTLDDGSTVETACQIVRAEY